MIFRASQPFYDSVAFCLTVFKGVGCHVHHLRDEESKKESTSIKQVTENKK